MRDFCLKYSKYKHLIKDADVLLFPSTKFPNFGWWISKYTTSNYSHAALACWNGTDIDCLEFREFKGSRIYPLQQYIQDGYTVDVFRPMSIFEHPIIEYTHNKDFYLSYDTHIFNQKTANKIIETAKSLIGIHYSWSTIFKMARTYIPFARLWTDIHINDDEWHDSHSFVCSTLIAYCYRKHFLDPVPFLADRFTSPGDLGRSGILFKLFSIC
jgi:hypothetical protein